MPLNDPQLATVAILVRPASVNQFERPMIHELNEPLCRLFSECRLGRAFRFAHFGRVNIGKPDLQPAKMDRVTIDNAGLLVRPTAISELSTAAGADASSARVEMSRCGNAEDSQQSTY
jgi:hypothetical protein